MDQGERPGQAPLLPLCYPVQLTPGAVLGPPCGVSQNSQQQGHMEPQVDSGGPGVLPTLT